MHVIEQYIQAKDPNGAAIEDALVVTSWHAAVIDGATPKSTYRYPTGETPGQLAARLIAQAIRTLSPQATAIEAVQALTQALHQPDVPPCNRPTASCVIYSHYHRQVWMLGDCQYATLGPHDAWHTHNNAKAIDHLLADWRSSVITSYLSRGLMTPDQLQQLDPGRHIIQPYITRQVCYQNMTGQHRLAYGMLDGEPIPAQYILTQPISPQVSQLILATDGYPLLLPTLADTEAHLHCLLQADPLCIGPLLGTKGVKPGQLSYDDRTYLRIAMPH